MERATGRGRSPLEFLIQWSGFNIGKNAALKDSGWSTRPICLVCDYLIYSLTSGNVWRMCLIKDERFLLWACNCFFFSQVVFNEVLYSQCIDKKADSFTITKLPCFVYMARCSFIIRYQKIWKRSENMHTKLSDWPVLQSISNVHKNPSPIRPKK